MLYVHIWLKSNRVWVGHWGMFDMNQIVFLFMRTYCKPQNVGSSYVHLSHGWQLTLFPGTQTILGKTFSV